MVAILTLILGFLVGLYISHHHIVVPCWETEQELRKELKQARKELWASMNITFTVHHAGTFTPIAVPHRTHSDVLFIPHPEDLLK